MKKIAVIGTGIMGNGIATNFLKNGYKVTVWNRNPERLKALLSQGAESAQTPQAATAAADIVFEVTANDESSKQVWLGKDGILAGATKQQTLITCATLSLAWVDELAEICAGKGLNFLDMPMTGGRAGAENGKLILLTGGEEKYLEAITPELKAISERIVYFGKAGSGMRYKLILNMVQGIHIAAFGEALRLAREMGLDINKTGTALAERPGGVTTNIAWRDYLKEPNPINFSVDWINKDLNYAKKSAGKIATPLLDLTITKYSQAIKQGRGQADWTDINREA
jgi:3-hydroxyisobutyrate dehydrogenase-like beta-hydroxyacid dehydrogenase